MARGSDLTEFDGMTMPQLSDLARELSFTATQDFQTVFERAEGPFIWDVEGKRYFDFSSGIGSANFGYAVPEIIEAVHREWFLSSGIPQQDFMTKTAIKAMARLCGITPGLFPKKVFFCNSGTETIEGAIKILIDSAPERKTFFHFRGSFHGRTLGSLALHGSKPVHREGFPIAPLRAYSLDFPEVGVKYTEWIDKFWKRMRTENICLDGVNAIFLELVQGEGGVNVADRPSLNVLINILRNRGVRIVVDEVQTGFYRTGLPFACDHYGIEPDLICLAKSFSSGFSGGAVVGKASIDFRAPGRISNTMGGVGATAAAFLAVTELMNKIDLEKMKESIDILSEFAPEGLGLMRRWRFAAAEDRDNFVREAKSRGVILAGAGVKNVRFMPLVTIDTELLVEALDVLRSIPIPHLP